MTINEKVLGLFVQAVRAPAGDGTAINNACLAIYPGLRQMVMYFTSGDRATIDDLCQDCWLKILKAMPRFVSAEFEDNNLVAYFMDIVRHEIVDHFRHEARLPETVNGDEIVSSMESGETSLLDLVLGQEIVDWLERFLLTNPLPPKQGEVFKWSLEGKTDEEIALKMGIDDVTVRTHKLKARNTVRVAFREFT